LKFNEKVCDVTSAFTASDGLAMSSRKACGIISRTKDDYTLKRVRPICNSLILMFLINSGQLKGTPRRLWD